VAEERLTCATLSFRLRNVLQARGRLTIRQRRLTTVTISLSTDPNTQQGTVPLASLKIGKLSGRIAP